VSLTTSTINVTAQWRQTRSVPPYGVSTQGPDSLVYSAAPLVATYDEVFLASYSLAAAATQTVDFRSFTSALGASVTATKVLGVLLKATATVTGAKLKIEPAASDGLVWFFGGTGPYVELEVGTDGAAFLVAEGVAQTVDATHKDWTLTNTGTQTATVVAYALVGTT